MEISLGSRFSISLGVAIRDDAGLSELSVIRAGRYYIAGKWFSRLPDGRFINLSLVPRGKYVWKINWLEKSAAGTVEIRGQYPFFTANGVPVWLDANGTFSIDPVDLVSRFQLRFRQQTKNANERRTVPKTVKQTAYNGYCDCCGSTFKGRRRSAQFCSDKCRRRSHYLRKVERSAMGVK